MWLFLNSLIVIPRCLSIEGRTVVPYETSEYLTTRSFYFIILIFLFSSCLNIIQYTIHCISPLLPSNRTSNIKKNEKLNHPNRVATCHRSVLQCCYLYIYLPIATISYLCTTIIISPRHYLMRVFHCLSCNVFCAFAF